jgi:hypothetical protein
MLLNRPQHRVVAGHFVHGVGDAMQLIAAITAFVDPRAVLLQQVCGERLADACDVIVEVPYRLISPPARPGCRRC